MKVEFTKEKVTKNTIRFTEVLPTELDTPKIGSLYVQKGTLKDLGWQDGMNLVVELTVKGEQK